MDTDDGTGKTVFLQKFVSTNAAELVEKEFEELHFLFDPILPSVGLAMLAGQPKTGKSWFCLDIAQVLTDEGSSVFYIAAEDNERRLQSRLKAKSFSNPQNLKLHAGLSQKQPIPRGSDALTYLRELHDAFKPDCIIIDTVSSILNPSASNKHYDVTVWEYELLRKLAVDLKVAILVVHHTKKTTDVVQTPLEKILGSTGITATVETLLVLQNVPGTMDRTLHVTGKDVEQAEFHLSWNGAGYNFSKDAAEAALGPTQRMVFDYVKEHPRCEQVRISKGLCKDQGQISKILAQLVERGVLIKMGDAYSAL